MPAGSCRTGRGSSRSARAAGRAAGKPLRYRTGVRTGSPQSKLITIRGNSASGKSAVAAEIRKRYGRGVAVIGQDVIRRDILRERDIPGGANISLISEVTRFALDHGFHVILEGILRADCYAEMLTRLHAEHAGLTLTYYLNVPFEETIRRHSSKPQARDYGRAEMRQWYRELDLLPGGREQVIPAGSTLDQTVRRIMTDASLGTGADP